MGEEGRRGQEDNDRNVREEAEMQEAEKEQQYIPESSN